MATFDSHFLLGISLEQATFCFVSLFRSFSLRGWPEGSPEMDCRDESMAFIDHFRHSYSAFKGSSEGFTDIVDKMLILNVHVAGLTGGLLPVQSYLSLVPNSVAVCTNEDSLAKYRELETHFISRNVASDPWSHLDSFGRSKFQKILTSVYKTSYRVPKAVTSSSSASESESSSSTHSPDKGGRKTIFNNEPTSEVSKSRRKLGPSSTKQCSSKD